MRVPGEIGVIAPTITRITEITSDNEIDRGSLAVIEFHQVIIIAQDNDIGVVEALDAACVGKSLLIIIDGIAIEINGVAIDIDLKVGLINAMAVVLVNIAVNAIVVLHSHLVLLRDLAIDGNGLSRLGDLSGLSLTFLGRRGIVIDVIIILCLKEHAAT